jgi:transcriptional regulator with XRE-family HTH domain
MWDELGPRLRAAREALGMSLRSLAAAIGVSPSLLSQVETGKTKPSVSTLYALVSQLGISTDTLLGREDSSAPLAPGTPERSAPAAPVGGNQAFRQTSAAEHPILEMENGVRWEKLSVLDSVDVEALRVTYQPKGSSSVEGRLMRHLGLEHIYLISGQLTLQLEFDTHVIRAGDSVAFDSSRPHLFVNRADVPAVGIWYIIGRKAALQESSAAIVEGLAASGDGAIKTAVDVLRTFRG